MACTSRGQPVSVWNVGAQSQVNTSRARVWDSSVTEDLELCICDIGSAVGDKAKIYINPVLRASERAEVRPTEIFFLHDVSI
jgi:hypothetical protein